MDRRQETAVRGILDSEGTSHVHSGPHTQVSRLGNPLFNEGHRPARQRRTTGTLSGRSMTSSSRITSRTRNSPACCQCYTRECSRAWRPSTRPGKPRADLEAILLTGIPKGIIDGFTNFTGPVQADMLRLNTSIPPTSKPSIFGLLGGDAAGFPNGRRVFDDVGIDRTARDRRGHIQAHRPQLHGRRGSRRAYRRPVPR